MCNYFIILLSVLVFFVAMMMILKCIKSFVFFYRLPKIYKINYKTEINNCTVLSRYCINIEIYVCNNISLFLQKKNIKRNVKITKRTDHKSVV